MRESSPPVVVVAAVDGGSDHGQSLATIARLLARQGCTVEVVVLNDAAPPDAVDAGTPVVVVDRFRRTGLGWLALALGARRTATALKAWRLRRWARRRPGVTWIVHPAAASILGFVDPRPSTVVGVLLDPADDARALAAAPFVTAPSLWLTVTDEQQEAIAAVTTCEVHALGPLHGQHVPWALPPPRDGAGPVLVVSEGPLDRTLDHASEVLWQVAAQHPDTTFTWALGRKVDLGRARRDAARLGLAHRVAVAPVDQAWAETPLLVISTSDAPLGRDLSVTASLHGIPIVGFDLTGLPGGKAVAHGDVEALVTQVGGLLSNSARRTAEGARLRRAAREVHRLEERAAPLLERLGRPSGG